MSLHPNLESVLNNVNKFINIDPHRQLYSEHFVHLKKTIFNRLRENKVFCYMFNGFQLEGSYGDNVKVSIPNEFDLVFHIKFPEQPLIVVKKDDDLPGNVFLDFTNVIKKIAKERQHENILKHLKQWLDKQNFLKIEKFQLFIQSCFVDVLSVLENTITFNGKTSSLSYKRMGPAHTIYVHQSVDFDYSVDFVPGILLNDQQSVILNVEGQWEAIPKPSQTYHHKSISFRASYYRQEHNIIKDKKQLKNVYRMLKKFRDTKTNMNKMKSYYIKTLFLHKASQEHSSYWTKPLAEIIIDMFKDLEKSLKEENLPFFWDHQLNLYNRYTPRLIREMLSCVESSRDTLEKAANNLTISLQNRVYRTFLNASERKILEAKSDLSINSDVKEIPNKFNPKCNTDEFLIEQYNEDDTTILSTSPKKTTCILC